MATTIDEAMALLTSWMNNKVEISLSIDEGIEAVCRITSVDGVHFTYSITVVTVTNGGYGLGDATHLIVRPGLVAFAAHNGSEVTLSNG